MNLALLAQKTTDDIIGTIKNPLPSQYQSVIGSAGQQGGLVLFLTNILRLVFVVAGIYAFINFILAGFQYMGAGGDSKAMSAAWSRIWQSMFGLVLIVGSFAMAALFSQVVFGDASFILNPKIYGPVPAVPGQ